MSSVEKDSHLTIFSITGCRHCRAAKSLLKETYHVKYVEINLDHHPDRRDEMVKLSQQKTVPQIFFHERHIGGNSDLEALHEAGTLQAALDDLAKLNPPKRYIKLPATLQDDVAVERPKDKKELRWEELLKICERMAASGLVEDRTYHLRSYKKCFVGMFAVRWMIDNLPEITTPEEAVALGQEMMSEDFFDHVASKRPFENDKYFYRFQWDQDHTALNTLRIFKGTARDASEVSKHLRKSLTSLFDKYLSADGNAVDYDGMGQSDAWTTYKHATEELQGVDPTNLTHPQKLAFWINLYNVLVIHGFLEKGVPTSNMERNRFFGSTRYRVGGHDYSLNDIEHGILRCNARHPYKLQKQFKKDDPRAKSACVKRDPRIHFALVCGAKSCPPISTYTPEKVDENLTLAAESFLENELILDTATNTVSLNKILYWYRGDFGADNEALLIWTMSFLNPTKSAALSAILKSKKYKVEFREYDWTVNKKSSDDEDASAAPIAS